MRIRTVVARLLGVQGTIIEDVTEEVSQDGETVFVVEVRPARRHRGRCGVCHRRRPGYDPGAGHRRWRGLDWGTTKVFLQSAAPRIECPIDGVVTEAVPWARHDSRFTHPFEDTCAWLAVHCSRTATAELLRVAWRTVTAICERVADEASTNMDRFADLRRIGIDEVAHRKGHRYITVVVDHDTGRLLWAAEGRDIKTLERFFDLLGPERSAKITAVSADGASWIETVVTARCGNAQLTMDPFHVVAWATKALDEVRRDIWNQARRAGHTAIARDVKGSRWALVRNPDDLTDRQRTKLSGIQRTNRPLYRAYLLKEQLRQVFRLNDPRRAMKLLDRWIAWALRCRLPAFVKVARSVRAHRAGIEQALRLGLSNARIEALNTRVRVLTRQAFGFGSAQAMIAMAMLALGGLCPPLPGRA